MRAVCAAALVARVCTARIWDDVLVLSVPSLIWSTLRLPSVRTGAPSQSAACGLGRHGHGICAIGAGEVLIYGGYAARAAKLGRTSEGGFAPNGAYLLRHSTPAAAAANRKATAQLGHEMEVSITNTTTNQPGDAQGEAQVKVDSAASTNGSRLHVSASAAALTDAVPGPQAQPARTLATVASAPTLRASSGGPSHAPIPTTGTNMSVEASDDLEALRAILRAKSVEEAVRRERVEALRAQVAAAQSDAVDAARCGEAAVLEHHQIMTTLQSYAARAEQLEQITSQTNMKLTTCHVISASTMARTLDDMARHAHPLPNPNPNPNRNSDPRTYQKLDHTPTHSPSALRGDDCLPTVCGAWLRAMCYVAGCSTRSVHCAPRHATRCWTICTPRRARGRPRQAPSWRTCSSRASTRVVAARLPMATV
jgi:hypothetical protein